MDEKSGMNFSEYVAILSGNTDLLEKTRLEKKVAALESERKSFSQNRASSEYKLQDIVRQVDGHRKTAERIKGDWKDFQSRVQKDADSAFLNPVQLKGVEGSDPKTVGKKLNEIADKANTGGEYFKIGTLYGFTLSVKTENTQKDGLFMRENRFFVEGEGNIKYSYNNGHIANDPVLASQNFLKALEKMPSLIETHEAKAEALEKDIPTLQEIVKVTWRKEDELKELKTELAALSRKIELSLKPVDEGEDKKEEEKHSPANASQILSTTERLQQVKEVMGERLVIGSVPQYNPVIQPKGIRL
jgi:predicted  nucleic acid-binding Zn-ribbon protein